MWKASIILLVALSGMAAAQESPPSPPVAPPSVTFEAPTQSEAPAADSATPALPGAENPAPAAPGAATGGATSTTPAPEAVAPVQAPDAAAETPATPAATAPATVPAESLPVHTDLISIVLEAHWVVLWVMIGLAVAAFTTLVILIQKLVEFALAFGKMSKTAKVLASAQSLSGAAAGVRGQKGPAAAMVRAAEEELRLAKGEPALQPNVRERTHAALARIDAGAAQKLRSATGILASVGSLAPFVGLFGTVFGIMNSFLAIAESKTTNLAIVAPGIAEALFATAIGLAAAIPAVLIYNICTRKLAKFRHRMADIAAATERLQSRDLDRLAAGQEV